MPITSILIITKGNGKKQQHPIYDTDSEYIQPTREPDPSFAKYFHLPSISVMKRRFHYSIKSAASEWWLT